MALDYTGLFTVIGKYVKTINTTQGYISALESAKDEIFAALENEDLEDYYSTHPAQFTGFQSQVVAWTTSLINNIKTVLQDRDYVIDELSIYKYTVTDILNGLYDYMIDNDLYITPSVVTLGGADADKAASETLKDNDNFVPVLFVSRTLDGVSAPGNNVTAHIRYDGVESQLAKSCTVTAELTSNTSIGSETAQLFTGTSTVESYQILTENPGNGPVLTNPEAANLIPNNYNFSSWTGDSPDNWSLTGTITTDYLDDSGSGTGPLQINTQGVTATQQVTGLTHSRLYFMALLWEIEAFSSTGANVVGIRLKNLAGTSIVTQVTQSMTPNADELFGIVYTFFRLPVTVDLTNIYFEAEFVTEDTTSEIIKFKKAVIAPASYYNGLGWVWWPSYHTSADASKVAVGTETSIAIANNNAGVFQTFFRKGFNIQLPTTGSTNIADSLAT